MSSAAVVTLIATVLAVQGPSARIDEGAASGLRAGDRGEAYYRLRVNGQYTRVSVGTVEIESATGSQATVRSVNGKTLRSGFQIEFRIPGTRLEAAQELKAAAAPATDAAPQAPPATLREEAKPRLEPEPQVEAASKPEMVAVPAGTYPIGVPYNEARYYNEVPRFHRHLDAFQIDAEPARLPGTDGGAPIAVTGPSYDEAAAACEQRGARLPTEFEWEVAVGRGFIAAGDPPIEWTASWYLPYPGNEHAEPEYGHSYRVVRGGSSNGAPHAHQRHYFRPEAHNPQIGYRCAREVVP